MFLDASTKFFFDSDAVLKSLDRATIRNLSKVGAFVRRRARSSIRRRKKSADAGSPPSAHSKDKFRTIKNIRFQYEPETKSVIAGPVKLNTSKAKGTKPHPELMEFGGMGVVTDDDGNDSFVSYEAHPFMGPALEEEVAAGTIADVWEDSMFG